MDHLCVAAYSQTHAVELLTAACQTIVSTSEIRRYYFPTWGGRMDDIHPTAPGVWAYKSFTNDKPMQVYAEGGKTENSTQQSQLGSADADV